MSQFLLNIQLIACGASSRFKSDPIFISPLYIFPLFNTLGSVLLRSTWLKLTHEVVVNIIRWWFHWPFLLFRILNSCFAHSCFHANFLYAWEIWWVSSRIYLGWTFKDSVNRYQSFMCRPLLWKKMPGTWWKRLTMYDKRIREYDAVSEPSKSYSLVLIIFIKNRHPVKSTAH